AQRGEARDKPLSGLARSLHRGLERLRHLLDVAALEHCGHSLVELVDLLNGDLGLRIPDTEPGVNLDHEPSETARVENVKRIPEVGNRRIEIGRSRYHVIYGCRSDIG